MTSLPEAQLPLLVRTYFGDNPAWVALRDEIERGSDEGFVAHVEFIDDRRFEGLTPSDLQFMHGHAIDEPGVLYVADERAHIETSHPVLLVRVESGQDEPFRCRADLLWEVDANLSLVNLDWDDFRDQVDDSGVYGGFGAVQVPTAPAVNSALLAFRSGSDELVTISLPAIPVNLWFLIYNELREAFAHSPEGRDRREYVAIAEQIAARDQDAKEQPDDDAVVTLPAREWAFIRARAKQLELDPDPEPDSDEDGDGRPHGRVAAEIVELVSRHLA